MRLRRILRPLANAALRHGPLRRLLQHPFVRQVLYYLHLVSYGLDDATSDPRTYRDPPTAPPPRFMVEETAPFPWAAKPARFRVDNGESTIEEVVYYSHLTLLKLCKHYEFESLLDLGSHEQRVTRIFRHLGKRVTTIEAAPGYPADYNADYLHVTFPEPFDAIWCSQTLEHQRNPGQFLDKLFDDLKVGGVLALTVLVWCRSWPLGTSTWSRR